MLTSRPKVGMVVSVLYPVHGHCNILQRLDGVIEKVAKGPNGRYLVLKTDKGYRSLLFSKIVVR